VEQVGDRQTLEQDAHGDVEMTRELLAALDEMEMSFNASKFEGAESNTAGLAKSLTCAGGSRAQLSPWSPSTPAPPPPKQKLKISTMTTWHSIAL